MRIVPLVLLAVVLAAASAQAAPSSKAFVFTTDYTTGSLDVVNLDNRVVTPCVAALHSDVRLRWNDGLLFVLNRFGQDNVQVIDPSANFATVNQYSTGNGSNPADIAFLSPTKAYVSRYGAASILVVHPRTGAPVAPPISLADFADADGIPEMDRMIRVGRWLFIAVQRLSSFVPTDSSLVVVIDTHDDTVVDLDPVRPGRQGILLSATNPVTTFEYDRQSRSLLIGCAGHFGALDGGIEAIDPAQFTSLGLVITEAALGGDVGDIVWNGRTHSYAIVSDASFNASLVSWSAVTGSKIATVFSPGGFSLPDCELNDRGELYVCDNDFLAPGLFVFSTPGDQLIAGPLDTCLPPNQIVFDRSNDVVAVYAEGVREAALASPWPNPARETASLRLTLARESDVRLEIHDLLGRRVRTLVAGPRPAGRLDATWDLRDEQGRTVRSGVYRVSACVGNREETRRLTVLR